MYWRLATYKLVTLDKSLHFSVPLFPHIQNGNRKVTLLVGLSKEEKGNDMHVESATKGSC